MPPFDVDSYQRLRTSTRVGAVVHYRERTGSTMDDAREGADAAGANGCGAAYVAGEQSAGRGRQGRSWVATAAAGLYVTYHLCPLRVERAPLLGVAGALAVTEALNSSCGLATRLKWPNDVMHEDRKIAGLLAEARLSEGLDVFLGIGINLRATSGMPPEVERIATSIERAGAPPPSLETLLSALSTALEPWVELVERDPAALIEAWRSQLDTLGRRIRLATPGGEVEGEAMDVNDRGELILRLDDGTTGAYAAGDVTTL